MTCATVLHSCTVFVYFLDAHLCLFAPSRVKKNKRKKRATRKPSRFPFKLPHKLISKSLIVRSGLNRDKHPTRSANRCVTERLLILTDLRFEARLFLSFRVCSPLLSLESDGRYTTSPVTVQATSSLKGYPDISVIYGSPSIINRWADDVVSAREDVPAIFVITGRRWLLSI